MRRTPRTPLSRRLGTGLLAAALAAAGLLPLGAAAHAAPEPAPAAAAGTNLALGRTATAGGSHGGYPAANVTDGSQQSYWEGPADGFPEWVQVDLGAPTAVDRVVLKLPTGWEQRTQTLSVLGSADGADFTTLAASAARAFVPSAANTVSIDLPEATPRFVRVRVTANTGWNAAQLAELEVIGEGPADPGEPPVQGGDLARGKPVEASSHTQTYLPAHANDGDVTTYWESAGFPADLTVDLGYDADVEAVRIRLNPASVWGPRTQRFEIRGRASGESAFRTLASAADHAFSPASGGNSVLVPVTGRVADVRLHFTGNTGAPGAQIGEIEVLGTATPQPDLVVTDLTWTPAAPTAADTVTVRAGVRNAGDAPSAATALEVSLEGTVAGSASVGALAPGQTTTVEVPVGTRAAGSYTLSAVVDPHDTVTESDNGNNSRTADSRLTVAQAPGPDLTVTGITTSPASPAVGADVSFTVAVRNRGTAAVPAGTVTELTAGTTVLRGTTPAVAAGATVDVPLPGTWTATQGGVTLTATADATRTVAETDEGNNILTRSLVVGRGAAVPWTTYEAEDGRRRGTLLEADRKRTFGHTNFATESSGRKAVRLENTGDYVEFTSTNAANSVVVRNSVPDAPNGGGQDTTLSLYADGQFVRKLTLSSKHSWLYGSTDDPEGLTNRPGADARRLFDETSALLGASYPAGTVFRLQRDPGDNAAFHVIDLIDLEHVAPPLPKPAECTSITEFGAVPNDGIDDTDAIQRAVTADQNGDIDCVWIPAGQWRQEQKILTDDPLDRGPFNQVGIRDVTIRGAGMWHSQLRTLTPPHEAGGINHPHEGNFGFDIDDNTRISDLAIFGSGTIRGGDGNHEGGVGLNGRFGKNTRISNVWIEHANVGVWVGRDHSDLPELWNPADGLEFSGMRVRNTYADGINLTNGTRNSTVTDSSFRNTGDDALAVWASKHVKDTSVDVAHDNHFRNNTVQLPWRANGIAIYGGHGNTVENNVIADTMNYPGIMLATDHDPLPFSGQTLVAGNALYRTGGAFWGEAQEFGAITLFAQGPDIPGVTIRDTEIHDSTYDGIQFKTGGGAMPEVTVRDVRIDGSLNGCGVLAMSGARGSATLTDVTITGTEKGDVCVEPGSQFTLTRD